MQNHRKLIASIAILITLGSFAVAGAAPYYTYQPTLVPQSNNAFDLGTSTQVWRNAYITQICLSADCRTAWPTGGGGSGGTGAATTSFAGTAPIRLTTSASAITYDFTGLATTTQPSSSNILVSNGGAGVYGVATTTLTGDNGLILSAGAGALVGGSNATIGLASISAGVLGAVASAVPTSQATSTLYGAVQNGKLLAGLNGSLQYVATTTFSSPLLYSAGNVTCQVASGSLAGCLSSTDWSTFNSKQATISATWPVILTGATLSFGGLSTSTAPTIGNLAYWTGVNTLGTVATSSETCSSGVTCAAHVVLTGGGAITLSTINAGVLGAQANGSVPTSQATSTLYGTGTGGQVLMWSNTANGLAFAATSTTVSQTPWASNIDGANFSLSNVSSASSTNFIAGAGSAATPSYSFSGDPNTGIYSDSPDIVSISGGGTRAIDFRSAQITFYTDTISLNSGSFKLEASAGTITAPTYAINNDINTGLWSQYLDALNLTVGGTEVFRSDIASTSFPIGNVGISSTSPAFRFSVNNAGSDFYIDSTGKIVGRDTTNSWSGRISPTRSFALTTGTTTAWTASTTNSAYSPYLVMPFAGTLRQVRCVTDASFLGVNTQVNGSNATPSYFVASTTVGKVAFTAGNTFSAGQKILANFGTTTTATAASISCTFDVTETI